MSQSPRLLSDYTLPPVPYVLGLLAEGQRERIEAYGHACAEHVRGPLIRDLAECFNLGGSDADGNGDEWRAANALRSVRQLRADYDEACDEGEKLRARIAELEKSFDELAAAVGWTKERCDQDGDSPVDVAIRLRAEVEAKDAALAALRADAERLSQFVLSHHSYESNSYAIRCLDCDADVRNEPHKEDCVVLIAARKGEGSEG